VLGLAEVDETRLVVKVRRDVIVRLVVVRVLRVLDLLVVVRFRDVLDVEVKMIQEKEIVVGSNGSAVVEGNSDFELDTFPLGLDVDEASSEVVLEFQLKPDVVGCTSEMVLDTFQLRLDVLDGSSEVMLELFQLNVEVLDMCSEVMFDEFRLKVEVAEG
jgi:hypothetical protein